MQPIRWSALILGQKAKCGESPLLVYAKLSKETLDGKTREAISVSDSTFKFNVHLYFKSIKMIKITVATERNLEKN